MQLDNSDLDGLILQHTPSIDYSSHPKQLIPLVKSVAEECQTEAKQALLAVMTKRYRSTILIDKWLRLNLVKLGDLKTAKLKDYTTELSLFKEKL